MSKHFNNDYYCTIQSDVDLPCPKCKGFNSDECKQCNGTGKFKYKT